MARPPVSELALARAWASGSMPSRLTTTDGQAIEIVFRGSWTHGSGPDFAGAMTSLSNGRLLTGSIEFHLTTSGWKSHGHQRDPAYNDVILHLVGEDDGAETRRADGASVPVVVVGFDAALATDAEVDWNRVGGAVCAEELARREPGLIVDRMRQLGDRRLATKSAQFEAALTSLTPSQALWAGLLDALGYQANRAPMAELASRLRLLDLERELSLVAHRFSAAAAMLLGAAGFLPLSPRDAASGALGPEAIAAIEREWARLRRVVAEPMRPTEWEAHRVRPANHPVARLLAAASLVAQAENGLTAMLLDPLRAGMPIPDLLLDLTGRNGVPLGKDRAIVIGANVLVPFAMALAEQTGEIALIGSKSRMGATAGVGGEPGDARGHCPDIGQRSPSRTWRARYAGTHSLAARALRPTALF